MRNDFDVDFFNYINTLNLKLVPIEGDEKMNNFLIVDPEYYEISVYIEGKFYYFISEKSQDSILWKLNFDKKIKETKWFK